MTSVSTLPSPTSATGLAATRYVVITPVRDEAEHLEHTIRSMVNQTVRPARWVLVDDGSTDGTGEIVDRWAAKYSWIIAIHRRNRGSREAGSGVMEAFFEGLNQVLPADWKFLVKLDGDLIFQPEYFENCFKEFAADSRLGIGGGVICHDVNGRLEVEQNPHFHVRGATKIYKRECWEKIGGLWRAPGWDTLDEVKANRLGWTTRSFPELKLHHLRFTGAAAGAWKNSVKNGLGSYICGYHPLFMLMKCVKNIPQKPYVVGSIGLLCGFVQGYLHRKPRIDDKESIAFLRQQQLRRLTLRPSIWK
jgi:poly-beta-1,6-N-acetyl-D-glucosamine synthase